MEEIESIQPESVLYTVPQLASHLNVSPKTVRNWYRTNKIPYLRIKGIIRFQPERVIRALEQGYLVKSAVGV